MKVDYKKAPKKVNFILFFWNESLRFRKRKRAWRQWPVALQVMKQVQQNYVISDVLFDYVITDVLFDEVIIWFILNFTFYMMYSVLDFQEVQKMYLNSVSSLWQVKWALVGLRFLKSLWTGTHVAAHLSDVENSISSECFFASYMLLLQYFII